jgi:sacsin
MDDDPKASKISQISISSEVDYRTRKDIDAESYTLHLAMQENSKGQEEECTYYMWKQKFAVKPECKIQKRMEVDQWVVTLAFPQGQRLSRGAQSPGVYAFLPTEMVTNLPFIIQADFLLASSRESILFDSQWNRGILECVPFAFVNAFGALLKSSSDAPLFALPPIFRFLPIQASSISLFENVRLSIKKQVEVEDIMPCESCTAQKFFCKPTEVSRLDNAFWRILNLAQKQGIDLQNISSYGTFVLSSYLDNQEYDDILGFLGVGYASKEWYSKCIDGLNLVKEASEEVYLQILYFVARNWTQFLGTAMMFIPLIKYLGSTGCLSYSSVEGARRSLRICTTSSLNDSSWLISWNKELSEASCLFFLPLDTQRSLDVFPGGVQIMEWLKNIVNMENLNPHEYASTAIKALNESRLALVYCHFLYHSHAKRYISERITINLCRVMPVVDNFGQVVTLRNSLLVPADGSKWAKLIGTNPWRSQKYIELSADYSSSEKYAGNCTSEGKLITFLRTYAQAADIPFILPPNSRFAAVSSPLAMENALLLLQWIRNLRSSNALPKNFLNCIKNGKWLKTSIGFNSPSRTFMSSSGWGSKQQIQFVFANLPIIDEEFYANRISVYKEELRIIGVQFEFANASVQLANQPLSMENAILLLQWIRDLRLRSIQLPNNVLSRIRNGKWLKTSNGYNAPSQSFMSSPEWANLRLVISELANVPLVDHGYYENKISSYEEELRTIGVQFEFSYTFVDITIKPLTMENAILLLQCIRNLRLRCVQLPQEFLSFISNGKWLKTSLGYTSPLGSFLLSTEWENFPRIQSVLDDLPIIDQDFYGNKISAYKEVLRVIGVKFEFTEAAIHICNHLMSISSTKTFTQANLLALLQSIRFLNESNKTQPHLIEQMRNGCWLKTCLDSRSPANSILYSSEWQDASVISTLPFIDTIFYGADIANFRSELKLFGVVVDFKQNYQLVVDNFRFSKDTITPSATILMLKCIRYAKESHDFVERLKDLRWLKTDIGFRFPREVFLVDDDWKCVLNVVDKVALLDLEYYGDEIRLYKEELTKAGLIADLKEASKRIVRDLKKLVHTSSVTKEWAVALLECYRELGTKYGKLPVPLANFLHRERWLHTSFGFRTPKEAILFGSAWEPIASVSSLPFIDDNNTQYGLGKEIYSYRDELIALGSKVGLEQGAAFVISGLNIPYDASAVTPEAVISLLKCIRNWRKNGTALPKSFMSSINSKWVKTTAGYRHPNGCILFESMCSSHVHRDDGPFIDEMFYGQELISYESELHAIGVVNARAGCALMAQHLQCLSNVDKISRIYSYLEAFGWKPRYTSGDRIWIPHDVDEGEWVNPTRCVLYDRNSLFGSQLHVLVKWYDSKLLRYFNKIFDVKRHPTVSDYCKLWSKWQDSNSSLAQKDCAAFWEFFGKNWSTDMGKFIAGCVTKVPVCSGDQILLLEKQDVFIPDDLQLEDLFKKQAQQPLFVWYPSASLPCLSPAKLNDIYSSIGVQKISKAVAMDDSERLKIEQVTIVHKGTVIKPGLLRIVLAFLANPILDISADRRHEIVSGLTNVVVYETSTPLSVSYQVGLSSGRNMVVTSARYFHWEREDSRLYVTKAEVTGLVAKSVKMEYAACFAEEISKGLLFENADQVPDLAELVRTGFLLDFDVPAIEILLKLKNLRLFEEDEQFLTPYTDGLSVPRSCGSSYV